jgi:hypothetical protein
MRQKSPPEFFNSLPCQNAKIGPGTGHPEGKLFLSFGLTLAIQMFSFFIVSRQHAGLIVCPLSRNSRRIVPKNGTHDFFSGWLHFQFLLCLRILVSPLHRLPLSLQFIVVCPDLISSDNAVKEIAHGLISFQNIGTSLHSQLFVIWH